MSAPTVEKLAYQQAEAAEAMGVSPWTIARWRKAGIIKAVKVGGILLYPREELLKAIRQTEAESGNGNTQQQ